MRGCYADLGGMYGNVVEMVHGIHGMMPSA